MLFTDTNGGVTFAASLPGRGGWKQRGERAVYRDGRGAVAGIRKATVRLHPADTVRRVKIAVSGVGGSYPTSLATMPHEVTVLLGDASAVVEGACGRRTFGPATCRSADAGRKLLCNYGTSGKPALPMCAPRGSSPQVRWVVLAGAAVVLGCLVIRSPTRRIGDGPEYVAMALQLSRLERPSLGAAETARTLAYFAEI